MNRKHFVLLIALFAITTPAFGQLNKPKPITIDLPTGDTTINIPISVSNPQFGTSYQVQLRKNIASTIPLTTGFMVLPPITKTINGAYNSDNIKVLIKRYPGATGVQTLNFDVQTTPPGGAFVDNFISITVDYSPILDPLLQVYHTKIIAEDAKYICDRTTGKRRKIVQDGVLDSNLSLIYANVVLSGNDLVKTGTAASIAQDKDKGTLSFNLTKILKSPRKAFNFGIATKSAGSIFNLFSPDSWVKEAGANIGFTYIFPGSQFFRKDSCLDLRRRRMHYYPSLSRYYERVLSEDYSKLRLQRKKIKEHYTTISPELMIDPPMSQKSADSTLTSLDQRISEYERIYYSVMELDGMDNDKVEKNVKDDLTKFDFQYNRLYGYAFHWLDGKVTFSNVNVNLSKDSLNADNKNLVDINSYLGASVYLSYNYTRLGLKTLRFMQVQGTFERGSYLNHPSIQKTPYVIYDSISQALFVKSGDNDKVVLGDYRDIKRENWSFILSVYGALFMGRNQNYGWDIRANFRSVLTNIPGTNQVNTFNILTGPVYRLEIVEKGAPATIGLKFGFVNALVDSHVAKEHFGIKLEVGVPFKWYYKAKS